MDLQQQVGEPSQPSNATAMSVQPGLTSLSAFFFFAEDTASTSPVWLKHMLSTPVVRLRTERRGLGRLSLRQESSYTLTTPDADLRGEGGH